MSHMNQYLTHSTFDDIWINVAKYLSNQTLFNILYIIDNSYTRQLLLCVLLNRTRINIKHICDNNYYLWHNLSLIKKLIVHGDYKIYNDNLNNILKKLLRIEHLFLGYTKSYAFGAMPISRA